MKKVIVACGGAVATSTVAANAIKDLCKENGIKVEILQMRMSEIESSCDGVDLIVTTAKMKKEFGGIPYLNGMPFLTGVNREATEEKILGYLK